MRHNNNCLSDGSVLRWGIFAIFLTVQAYLPINAVRAVFLYMVRMA